MHILSHQMPILLERDEQGYAEIHCKLCSLPMRKSSTIPTTDDRDTR